jgi:Tol biopolymer transport system component
VGRRKVAAALLGVVVVAGATGWVASRMVAPSASGAGTRSSPLRFQVVPDVPVKSERASFREFAVHPGGTALAFANEGREIQLHDLTRGETRAIPGAGGGQPFFSADGEWLGFYGSYERIVYKIPVAGGRLQRLCTFGYGENPAGFAWRGDWIVFALREGRGRGLWKIPASGGERERLGDDPRLGTGMHPSFLPDRDAVLFNSRDDDESLTEHLRVVELASGAVTDLGVEGRTPHYLSSGHLVWARDDDLLAARFDPDRLRITGTASPVLEAPSASATSAPFSASPRGTLVTLEPAWYDLVEIGLDGARRKLAEAPTWMHQSRYSFDGAFVAYTRGGHGMGEVWIHEIATGRESKLAGSWRQFHPVWTPRGEIVYTDSSYERFRLMLAPTDRRRDPQVILEDDEWLTPFSVSRSGILLYRNRDKIWSLDLARSGSSPEVWLNEPVHDTRFSPDGRWVAYFDGDASQVFVRPYPGPGAATLASIVSGWHATWSADGGTLYFEGGTGGVDAVPVRVMGNDLVVGASREVRTEGFGELAPNYDTKPVGTGFVVTERRKDLSRFTVVVGLDRLIAEGGDALATKP